jgi:hypothetical protein
MGAGLFPLAVLSEALAEKIDGRRVRTAVFTTYSFDPGFFELHILPTLFDRPFSQVEKVRRIQLEDALRSIDHIAVYYDRTALSQDAVPAQLDFRRIDVRRATGVFHPKLVMLLVENEADEEEDELAASEARGPLSLIVAVSSANLTRAGWWESVEAGHIEEIEDESIDDSRCPYRRDLLALIRRIRSVAAVGEDHSALDAIHNFIRHRTNRGEVKKNRASGRYYTRLYVGQSDLADWLEEIGLARREWNLEVISPFFDRHDAGTLERLIDVLEPQETRIYLPREHDGTAGVAEDFYDAVAELPARWSTLPSQVLRPGARGSEEKAPPRRVHAKVYRIWRRDTQDITLTGSVNLTAPAHSHAAAGNLEAAFLVDITDDVRPKRWWLEPLDGDPKTYVSEQTHEADESQEVCVHISFRYDWGRETLEYRIEETAKGPLVVAEPSGRVLFELKSLRAGKWRDCGAGPAKAVRELLKSTSFVLVKHAKGEWRVLVREEGMSHRPSLIAGLTPEEILLYWSLLSTAQKEAFIEEKLAAQATIEGLPVDTGRRYDVRDTVFDRFAGVYHAFEQLFHHVQDSIQRGEEKEATARLFGAKYDSLPVLLEKVRTREEPDPVIGYVTFLSARQVCDRIAKAQPQFWRQHRKDAKHLGHMLAQLPEMRTALPLEGDPQREKFLDWYESMFLKAIQLPPEAQ